MTTEEKAFTLRIPVDLLAQAHDVAKAIDLSLAQLIRRLLRSEVEKIRG